MPTCTITDSASSTKTPPTNTSSSSCLIRMATVPSAPPSASDPTSPMKISAGCALYQRKPRLAPTRAPQKIVSSPTGAEVHEQQVRGQHRVTGDVGQRGERGGGDGERADRESVEPVGEVDGIAGADQHECRKRHVEPAEVGNQLLEEREDEPRVVQVVRRQPHQRQADQQRHHDLQPHLLAREQPAGRAARDLEVVVEKPDGAERGGGQHRDPDVDVGQVDPEQRRDRATPPGSTGLPSSASRPWSGGSAGPPAGSPARSGTRAAAGSATARARG